MKTLEQLHTLAASTLVPGEEPVAAVGGIAEPGGTGPDPDTLVAFPAAKQMALLLTGGRLLAWSLGFSGKPKHYLGEVPLSAVREVHAGEIRFGPLVRVVMKSGATVDLEILRNEEADDFIDHLRHLVSDDPATATPTTAPEPREAPPDADATPPDAAT